MAVKLLPLFLILGLFGCSSTEIITSSPMPIAQQGQNITLFVLDNYTTSPQAGARAANIIEGILIARGYNVITAFEKNESDVSQQLKIAKKNNSRYLLNGGVSEWRYKTGIDGEPAISVQLKLIDVTSKNVIWNSVASGNDWGNASIGTTAQNLFDEMMQVEKLD